MPRNHDRDARDYVDAIRTRDTVAAERILYSLAHGDARANLTGMFQALAAYAAELANQAEAHREPGGGLMSGRPIALILDPEGAK